MNKIDKVVQYFRNLNEEPTNSVGNTGYQGGGDQSKAGYDKVVGLVRRTKKKYLKSAPRKPWLDFLRNGRGS
jgi:hypothetical protein